MENDGNGLTTFQINGHDLPLPAGFPAACSPELSQLATIALPLTNVAVEQAQSHNLAAHPELANGLVTAFVQQEMPISSGLSEALRNLQDCMKRER